MTAIPLQRGHAFSGVETAVAVCQPRRNRASFKGATPSQAWRRRQPSGHRPDVLLTASKGPRLLRRGDVRCGPNYASRGGRLQRGHAFSGVETVLTSGRRAVANRILLGFKGATPSQAWRLAHHEAHLAELGVASKGPRLLRRGDGVSE